MIDPSEAIAIEWAKGERRLLWRHERLPKDAIQEIKDTDQSVFGWHIDYGDSRWFCLWVQDCHDPPLFLIDAQNLERAEEEFVEAFGERLNIFIDSDHDPRDRPELSYSSNALPYDSSLINGNGGWKINRIWCDQNLLTPETK